MAIDGRKTGSLFWPQLYLVNLGPVWYQIYKSLADTHGSSVDPWIKTLLGKFYKFESCLRNKSWLELES